MAEELLQFLIFINVFLIGILFYCWIKLGQEADRANEIFEQYSKLVIGGKKDFEIILEWLLKDDEMLPEICSCGYRFENDETICPNCGKKVEEDG